MKTIIAITAVAAIFTSVSATAATPDAERPTLLVHYDDLNLGSARGQAMLDQRIMVAAKTVCGVSGNIEELARAAQQSRCVRAAVASSHTQVAMLRGPVLAAR